MFEYDSYTVKNPPSGIMMNRAELVTRLRQNLDSARKLLAIVDDKSDTRTLKFVTAEKLRGDIRRLGYFVDYFGSATEQEVFVTDVMFGKYVHFQWQPEHAQEQDVLEKAAERLKKDEQRLKSQLEAAEGLGDIYEYPPTVTPWWRFWE